MDRCGNGGPWERAWEGCHPLAFCTKELKTQQCAQAKIMSSPRYLAPKSGPWTLQGGTGAVHMTTVRCGLDRLLLTEPVVWLFTRMFFQMDSNHSNTITRGHTRQSTSKTHLLQEMCSTPKLPLHCILQQFRKMKGTSWLQRASACPLLSSRYPLPF